VARVSVLRPKGRPVGAATLHALLTADRFRLGRDTARVAGNLAAHAGSVDDSSPIWIGADLPPHGAPSLSLGAARGTLGPWSFGFLDNVRGVAAFAAPLATRPRVGPIALVCRRREALPDVAPLAVARGLGVSWIISIGDGEVEDTLDFLASDAATRAVLLAAGNEAGERALRPGALAPLGDKPAVVLGGDPLLRAAARRAGGAAVDDLEAWFAHGALLDAGVTRPERPVAVVIGGGAQLLEQAARSASVKLPIHATVDDDAEAVAQLVADAAREADLLIIAGSEPPPRPSFPSVLLDLGSMERARALLAAIATQQAPTASSIAARAQPQLQGEREQAIAIVDAAAGELSDHDAKRVLKLFGVRVSRQAPASSATKAVQIAQQVGYPVDIVAGRVEPASGRGAGRELLRRVTSQAEVRRAAAILLEDGPFVLVREAFPLEPRARLAVRRERGLGAFAVVAGVSEERALLPLEPADALVLARAATGQAPRTATTPVERALIDLLVRATFAAVECELTLDLEVYVGAEPGVVSASGRRK
jgi:hypothetical protein